MDLRQLQALGRDDRSSLLVDYLRSIDYRTSSIAALWGGESAAKDLLGATARHSFMLSEELAGADTPLQIASSLFLFGGRVPLDRYERVMPAAVRALLEAHAAVRVEASVVSSEIAVVELGEQYFVSDILVQNLGEEEGIVLNERDDLAMPPHYSTLSVLGALRDAGTSESLLDLGCGSGCLSIAYAKGRTARIAGIDLNERAVEFSRLNAKLNGADVRYEHADCMKYTAEPYQRIIFNDPGGLALPFIDRRLRELLTPDGVCDIWCWLELLHQDADVAGLIRRSVRDWKNLRFEVTIDKTSAFSVGPEAVAAGKLPRASFLTPAHAGAWKAKGVKQVVTTLIRTRFAREGNSQLDVTEVPSLVDDAP